MPLHVYELPGTYDVTVSAVSTGNCPASISFVVEDAVTVYPAPQAGLHLNKVELLNRWSKSESLAQSSSTVTYWMSDGGSLGQPNGQYIFSDGGTFEIIQTVTSPYGCTATIWGEVVVNGTIFHAPSAFTPDQDGLNDVWLPIALGVTSYDLEVRNRWGDLIWSTDDSSWPMVGGKSPCGTHYNLNGHCTCGKSRTGTNWGILIGPAGNGEFGAVRGVQCRYEPPKFSIMVRN